MYQPKLGRFISEDPLGFLAGDSNLSRYVGNSPTNATDPSGQGGMVIGHHWAPVSVFMQPKIRSRLSDEAVQYAAGAYSSPLDPSHCGRPYGGVPHHRYNELVRDELQKFIKNSKSKKLTVEEMQKFVDQLRQGKGADGNPVRDIERFNKAIREQVKDPPKPSNLKEVLEAGKRYLQTSRFRLLAAAAVVAGALADAVVAHAQILNCTAKSYNFRYALQALEEGNLDEARRRLIGENDSVYVDIMNEAGAHPALNFQRAIEEAFERAKEAEFD